MGVAGAIALAAMLGCKAEDDGGGPSNSGAGAVGGGGAGGIGGMGGAGGAGAGGTGGIGGGGAGGAGGAAGAAGVMGGVGGMMGGVGGAGTGGVAGTEAGSAGSAGTMMMGDGGVTDTASCIAAAAADGRTGACSECGCMKCLDEIMNCQDEGCQAVVTCGQNAGCSGSACYCGEGVDPLNCAVFPGPSGPCIQEIESASGLVADGTCETMTCASALSMLSTTDPDNAVQRARALSICTQGQRYAAATAVTPETPEVMGMCETECGTADAGM